MADQLGIIAPKKEFLLPMVKNKSEANSSGGSALVSALSLFGNDKELISFDDELDDRFNFNCFVFNCVVLFCCWLFCFKKQIKNEILKLLRCFFLQ